jgi:hypothetical protein
VKGQLAAVFALVTALFATVIPTHARADGPITYTVEPWDLDGAFGIVQTRTQLQLGGSMCPCEKVPYPADGLHNQEGVDALARVPFKTGDTLMGFSLGTQVISMFLATHTLPAGVKVVLLGDTFWRNDQFLAQGTGVPLNIANQVTMVANEYDGWSDQPDITSSPGYSLAQQNANAGMFRFHNYVKARLNDPANVVTAKGNITAILIPTQKLPLNGSMRDRGENAQADALDAQQRAQIDSAYSRPAPTPAQLAAATPQQVER